MGFNGSSQLAADGGAALALSVTHISAAAASLSWALWEKMTFAIITPALIVGAYVERVSLSFVILFSSLWMLIVYSPIVHWVWGGGLLSNGSLFEKPVMDFAGGIVVHETAGIAALTIASL